MQLTDQKFIVVEVDIATNNHLNILLLWTKELKKYTQMPQQMAKWCIKIRLTADIKQGDSDRHLCSKRVKYIKNLKCFYINQWNIINFEV